MTPLADGLARKQRGMETMECVDGTWIRRMRVHALARSLAIGEVSTDDLRQLVEDGEMPPPKHPQAWGCVLRSRHWVYLHEQPSIWPSNHGRRVTVWRWID
mgnify:CR=1 FL=1